MKVLSFLIIFLVSITINCQAPTTVIEITTWDPKEIKNVSINEKPAGFRYMFEESYFSGKSLYENDKVGFYNKLKEEDIKFFTPNIFGSYAIAYAHYKGLFHNDEPKFIKNYYNITDELSIKKIDAEADLYTLQRENKTVGAEFVIADSSVLLESSSFDCPAKKTQVIRNKLELPASVTQVCELALQHLKQKKNINIQTLLEIYTDLPSNRNTKYLEACIEQYVFAVYFSSDTLIKINSGKFLSEIMLLLKNKSKTAKFYYYNIPSEMFLSLITVFQKIFQSTTKANPASLDRLYWSTLQGFRQKLFLEFYEEEKNPRLRILIRGSRNQPFFNMNLTLAQFEEEVLPYEVQSFQEFRELCDDGSSKTQDLRPLLLKTDFKSTVNDNRSPISFLMIVVGVLLVIIGLSYCCSSPSTKQSKEIEFKRIQSQETDERTAKVKRKDSFEEDDSYAV